MHACIIIPSPAVTHVAGATAAAAAAACECVGEWFEDKRHGSGVMEWPDGRRYDGEWVADQMVDPSLITQDSKGKGDGQDREGHSEDSGDL
jgi:hypothetical protein